MAAMDGFAEGFSERELDALVAAPVEIGSDRLRWDWGGKSMRALLRGPKPAPGRRSRPVAKSRLGDLRWGWTDDAFPVWVRRWHAGCPPNISLMRDEARQAMTEIDVIVPATVRDTAATELVFERIAWGLPWSEPRKGAVASFVEDALRAPLSTGRLVITGEPHVCGDGTLIVEDVGGIVRFDAVDRGFLRDVLEALAYRSRRKLEGAIAHASGPLHEESRWFVKKLIASLTVEWNALAFALALLGIAEVLRERDSAFAPGFSAVSEELAHRLELAARYPTHRALAHSHHVVDVLTARHR